MATTPKTSFGAHCVIALTFTALACSPAPAQERPAAAPTPERDAPPLALGQLHELVPAAGLRWMVVGKPRKISENAELSAALRTLLPAQRLDAFAQGTAVDLRTLPSALVAGFDLGTLYLAELPEPRGHEVLDLFVERLAGRAVLERPHQRITRATGTIDGIPHGFVDLDGRVVGVSVGDLTLSRVPIGFAMGKLDKTVPALRGAALSTLPERDSDCELVFYAPGPFEDEWAHGAGGVLAASFALAIRVEPAGGGYLRATATLAGEWEPGGQQAADALKLAFEELASSPTGKLFALDSARSVTASFHPQYLTLSAILALEPLARGLRAAVIADVWEILDLPQPGGGASETTR